MDSRDFDASRPQLLDHRIDLLAGQDEVAGDRSFSTSRRLEVDSGRDASWTRRRQLHTTFTDGIASWDAKCVDAAIVCALCADDLIELTCIEVDRGRLGRRRRRGHW